MASSILTNPRSFTLIDEDRTYFPHLFELYKFEHSAIIGLNEIVQGCLRAWSITAPAYYTQIVDTGFQSIGLDQFLNRWGLDQLPPTPPEDNNVAKCPPITDMTEVLVLKCLKEREPMLIFPYPRVFHKELANIQHHGIDLLGYNIINDRYKLYLVEVMASVEENSTLSVVNSHHEQLYDQTINQENYTRLLLDLNILQQESDEQHKNVLNGFITAILDGTMSQNQDTIVVPALVRRKDECDISHWRPFYIHADEYTHAKLPSIILFIAIDIQSSFSELLDEIKITASGSIP